MKKALVASILAVTMMVLGSSAYAAIIHLSANLGGTNENPVNASPGTGFTFVDLDTTAHSLRIFIAFSGLLGTTTAAHIHCCIAPPGNVGVATTTPSFAGFPLGVKAGTYDQTLDLTLASSYNPSFVTAHTDVAGAEAFLSAGLIAGTTYLNIHSASFPGGEIRGFLRVPEPATMGLFGLGLVGLLALRRRRS